MDYGRAILRLSTCTPLSHVGARLVMACYQMILGDWGDEIGSLTCLLLVVDHVWVRSATACFNERIRGDWFDETGSRLVVEHELSGCLFG